MACFFSIPEAILLVLLNLALFGAHLYQLCTSDYKNILPILLCTIAQSEVMNTSLFMAFILLESEPLPQSEVFHSL